MARKSDRRSQRDKAIRESMELEGRNLEHSINEALRTLNQRLGFWQASDEALGDLANKLDKANWNMRMGLPDEFVRRNILKNSAGTFKGYDAIQARAINERIAMLMNGSRADKDLAQRALNSMVRSEALPEDFGPLVPARRVVTRSVGDAKNIPHNFNQINAASIAYNKANARAPVYPAKGLIDKYNLNNLSGEDFKNAIKRMRRDALGEGVVGFDEFSLPGVGTIGHGGDTTGALLIEEAFKDVKARKARITEQTNIMNSNAKILDALGYEKWNHMPLPEGATRLASTGKHPIKNFIDEPFIMPWESDYHRMRQIAFAIDNFDGIESWDEALEWVPWKTNKPVPEGYMRGYRQDLMPVIFRNAEMIANGQPPVRIRTNQALDPIAVFNDSEYRRYQELSRNVSFAYNEDLPNIKVLQEWLKKGRDEATGKFGNDLPLTEDYDAVRKILGISKTADPNQRQILESVVRYLDTGLKGKYDIDTSPIHNPMSFLTSQEAKNTALFGRITRLLPKYWKATSQMVDQVADINDSARDLERTMLELQRDNAVKIDESSAFATRRQREAYRDQVTGEGNLRNSLISINREQAAADAMFRRRKEIFLRDLKNGKVPFLHPTMAIELQAELYALDKDVTNLTKEEAAKYGLEKEGRLITYKPSVLQDPNELARNVREFNEIAQTGDLVHFDGDMAEWEIRGQFDANGNYNPKASITATRRTINPVKDDVRLRLTIPKNANQIVALENELARRAGGESVKGIGIAEQVKINQLTGQGAMPIELTKMKDVANETIDNMFKEASRFDMAIDQKELLDFLSEWMQKPDITDPYSVSKVRYPKELVDIVKRKGSWMFLAVDNPTEVMQTAWTAMVESLSTKDQFRMLFQPGEAAALQELKMPSKETILGAVEDDIAKAIHEEIFDRDNGDTQQYRRTIVRRLEDIAQQTGINTDSDATVKAMLEKINLGVEETGNHFSMTVRQYRMLRNELYKDGVKKSESLTNSIAEDAIYREFGNQQLIDEEERLIRSGRLMGAPTGTQESGFRTEPVKLPPEALEYIGKLNELAGEYEIPIGDARRLREILPITEKYPGFKTSLIYGDEESTRIILGKEGDIIATMPSGNYVVDNSALSKVIYNPEMRQQVERANVIQRLEAPRDITATESGIIYRDLGGYFYDDLTKMYRSTRMGVTPNTVFESLEKFRNGTELIALDFETTGLLPTKGPVPRWIQPTELFMQVASNGQNGLELGDSFHYYIRPNSHVKNKFNSLLGRNLADELLQSYRDMLQTNGDARLKDLFKNNENIGFLRNLAKYGNKSFDWAGHLSVNPLTIHTLIDNMKSDAQRGLEFLGSQVNTVNAKTALKSFAKEVDGRILTGQNVLRADWNFFQAFVGKYKGIPMPKPAGVIELMMLDRMANPDGRARNLGAIVRRNLGFKMVGAHGAQTDTGYTLAAFDSLNRKLPGITLDAMQEGDTFAKVSGGLNDGIPHGVYQVGAMAQLENGQYQLPITSGNRSYTLQGQTRGEIQRQLNRSFRYMSSPEEAAAFTEALNVDHARRQWDKMNNLGSYLDTKRQMQAVKTQQPLSVAQDEATYIDKEIRDLQRAFDHAGQNENIGEVMVNAAKSGTLTDADRVLFTQGNINKIMGTDPQFHVTGNQINNYKLLDPLVNSPFGEAYEDALRRVNSLQMARVRGVDKDGAAELIRQINESIKSQGYSGRVKTKGLVDIGEFVGQRRTLNLADPRVAYDQLWGLVDDIKASQPGMSNRRAINNILIPGLRQQFGTDIIRHRKLNAVAADLSAAFGGVEGEMPNYLQPVATGNDVRTITDRVLAPIFEGMGVVEKNRYDRIYAASQALPNIALNTSTIPYAQTASLKESSQALAERFISLVNTGPETRADVWAGNKQKMGDALLEIKRRAFSKDADWDSDSVKEMRKLIGHDVNYPMENGIRVPLRNLNTAQKESLLTQLGNARFLGNETKMVNGLEFETLGYQLKDLPLEFLTEYAKKKEGRDPWMRSMVSDYLNLNPRSNPVSFTDFLPKMGRMFLDTSTPDTPFVRTAAKMGVDLSHGAAQEALTPGSPLLDVMKQMMVDTMPKLRGMDAVADAVTGLNRPQGGLSMAFDDAFNTAKTMTRDFKLPEGSGTIALGLGGLALGGMVLNNWASGSGSFERSMPNGGVPAGDGAFDILPDLPSFKDAANTVLEPMGMGLDGYRIKVKAKDRKGISHDEVGSMMDNALKQKLGATQVNINSRDDTKTFELNHIRGLMAEAMRY